MEGIAFLACAPFCAQRKEESCRTNFQRKRDPTAKRKTCARASSENTKADTTTKYFGVKIRTKTSPKAASGANLARRASWEALGVTLGAIFSRFGVILGLKFGAKTGSNFRAIFGGPKV